MDYLRLKTLSAKTFFDIEDVAQVFAITPASARVLAARYVKKGAFVRLKNNFYVLDQQWERYGREDFFRAANFLQVPSYVSLTSALSWHEVTSQVQQYYVESVCLKRSVRFEQRGVVFQYYKVREEYYFGFQRMAAGVFMAGREKALADVIYLWSFGKYNPDWDAIDLGKINKRALAGVLKVFPERTREMAGKLCGI